MLTIAIRTSPEHLVIKKPWRSAVTIPWKAISGVVGVARGDGDCGDDVDIVIRWAGGAVSLADWPLVQSGLLTRLSTELWFDPDAYRQAMLHEPRGLDFVFGKRFSLMRSRSHAKT